MKSPFFDLGLALRGEKNLGFLDLGYEKTFFRPWACPPGEKISDFSTLGLKSSFFDLGLALRGKNIGFFDLMSKKAFFRHCACPPGENNLRFVRPWV